MDNTVFAMWMDSCRYVESIHRSWRHSSSNTATGNRNGGGMSGNFTCSDSLLTECMPQLSSLFPTSVQYDCSVPSDMFSEQDSTPDRQYHSADSIETIARSLSRNIHSSEVIECKSTGRVRQDSYSVLGHDEADTIFGGGIAADDMCSLLEQFEEASGSLSNGFALDLDFPRSLSEPSTRVTSPTLEHSDEINQLEVVKLLKAKHPLQIRQPYSHSTTSDCSPRKSVASKSNKCSVRSSSTHVASVQSSPASVPTTTITLIPSACDSGVSQQVSPNYYKDIRDHDYCSNVHNNNNNNKTSSHTLSPKKQICLTSSTSAKAPVDEAVVNPEGSMLKSLLINSELMEKMKQETLERRASSSSCKSAEEVAVKQETEPVEVDVFVGDTVCANNNDSKNYDIVNVKTQNDNLVKLNENSAVDFEQLMDADIDSKMHQQKKVKVTPPAVTLCTSAASSISIVTVTKAPSEGVTPRTLKKTFTLEELIEKDMKQKAIEKAKLEAILQTTPRSTPKTTPLSTPRSTPRSSPYQSPRKSDSPKLPELPELTLTVPSVKPPESSGGISNPRLVPLQGPTSATSSPDKVSQPSKKLPPPQSLKPPQPKVPVVPNVNLAPAVKVPGVKDKHKVCRSQEATNGRQRTESKCLEVVDMDVDDNEIVDTIEVATTDETPDDSGVFDQSSVLEENFISKATRLVQEIVMKASPAKNNNLKPEYSEAVNPNESEQSGPAETNAMEDQASPVESKCPDACAVDADTEGNAMDTGNGALPRSVMEEVEETQPSSRNSDEDLYEVAMDIHADVNDGFDDDIDDSNDIDNIAYDFAPVTEEYLNPNPAPLQLVPGASGRSRDPLGLENDGIIEDVQVPLTVEGTRQGEDGDVEQAKTSKRNYRKRGTDTGADSPAHDDNKKSIVFDKLPNYFRALTVPNKYTNKGEVNASKLINGSVPDRDRDPSPDRSDPTYNKVPSYVRHFTNSTKYDDGYSRPQSQSSSRSQTPTSLVIAATSSRANSTSRPTSRAVSRESTPPRAYKAGTRSRTSSLGSSSSSCSSCSSHSSDYCSSRSRSRSRRRSSRRSRDRRHNRSSRRRTLSSRSSRGSSNRLRTKSRSRSPIDDRRRRRRRRSSRSTSRSSSAYSKSRSRSRSSSRARDRRRRGERRDRSPKYRSRRRSRSLQRRWQEKDELKDKRKEKQIQERRIVYVGRISPQFTRRDLKRQFEQFGDIEDTSVHFRESGGRNGKEGKFKRKPLYLLQEMANLDHYGFVTFMYTCDAFAAIEHGNKCKGLEKYDLCFGGRRQFCKESYEDLDGNAEEEEEMAPVMPKRGGDLDFDSLLRQTQKLIQKKKKTTS